MNTKPALAFSVALLTATGCAVTDATDAPEGVASTHEAIINGSQVTDRNNIMARSIVNVSSTNYALNDSSSWILTCTGNIVGSQHVVTGAHCGPNATSAVWFFGGESRAVSEVTLYPSAVAGHDIAVLRLSAPIPNGYLPMTLATRATVGETLFGAGYGQHQPAATGLFWNTSSVRQVGANVIDLTTAFTNPGDSGGPIFRFANDRLDLVGTLRGGATYTNVPYYRAWLTAAMSASPVAGGSISFAHSGKCVDVPGESTASGVALQQFRCHGGNSQRFVNVASRYGSGTRRYRNVASGLCLDLAGTTVVQRPCDANAASQVWELFNNDYVNPTPLRNKANGQCLDVPSSSTADGVRLQTFACHGGNNQRVRLLP